jgi:hypothetical protein
MKPTKEPKAPVVKPSKESSRSLGDMFNEFFKQTDNEA